MTTPNKAPDAVLPELLPCPFCGSPAKARFAHGEYWITCTRTGVCFGNQSAHAKDSEGKYMHGFTYYTDAAKRWNTRAALASPEPDFAGLANEIANGQERLGPEIEGIIANHLGDYMDDGDKPETITENPKSWAAWKAEELARLASPDTAGWQLVPVEPTEAMVDAARGFSVPGYCLAAEQWPTVYRAILAAAPQPPKESP